MKNAKRNLDMVEKNTYSILEYMGNDGKQVFEAHKFVSDIVRFGFSKMDVEVTKMFTKKWLKE